MSTAPSDLAGVEAALARERGELDAWLDAAYADLEPRVYSSELDFDYPGWEAIEALVGSAFDRELVQRLAATSIDSLLFFVSRNEERSILIGWISPRTGTPFSWCGHLSYSDFLFLAEQALHRPADYCDFQLATAFRKCDLLDDRAKEILRRFFAKDYSYTRRMVVRTFEHFRLPETIELVTRLWQSDDDEHAKLSCLQALSVLPQARAQFETYLEDYRNSFDVEAEEYRRTFLRSLAEGAPSPQE